MKEILTYSKQKLDVLKAKIPCFSIAVALPYLSSHHTPPPNPLKPPPNPLTPSFYNHEKPIPKDEKKVTRNYTQSRKSDSGFPNHISCLNLAGRTILSRRIHVKSTIIGLAFRKHEQIGFIGSCNLKEIGMGYLGLGYGGFLVEIYTEMSFLDVR